jgi:phosphate-selective porin OprO/OprP
MKPTTLLTTILVLTGVLPIHAEEAAPTAAVLPPVVANPVATAMPRQALEVKAGGILQVDGRKYLDSAPTITDGFLLRRARLIAEVTVQDLVDFRLMPEFAGSKLAVMDAWIDVHPRPWLRLRAGKFKSGVGMQRLMSDTNYELVERAFPTALTPSRDLGVMLHGEILKGVVAYGLGVFDGAVDGGNPDTDSGNAKDVEGRVWLHPFRLTDLKLLHNVGVGFSGSHGYEHGSASAAALPTYSSPGQLTIFQYRASTTTPTAASYFANGVRQRLNPGLYAFVGPGSLLAEYISSSQQVTDTTRVVALKHTAWFVSAGWVITGENAAYKGVTPASPVTPAGGWGAVEVAVRYEAIDFAPASFTVPAGGTSFADPAKSVRSARGLGGGVNWYLSDVAKVSLTYERTTFKGGAASSADRAAEKVLLGRMQMAF